MDKSVYKLLTIDEWDSFEAAGVFNGAPIDLQDGYIHLSSAEHVRETARLHFKQTDDLKLVEVMTAPVRDRLRFEASRGGILFPHLYGELNMDVVGRVWHLTRDETGHYRFPEEVG